MSPCSFLFAVKHLKRAVLQYRPGQQVPGAQNAPRGRQSSVCMKERETERETERERERERERQRERERERERDI